MSGIGQIVPKVQEFVTALASAPQPNESRFIRNARPFTIYLGSITLFVMGTISVCLKDTVTTIAVVAGVGAVLQQFGAQRSREHRLRRRPA